MTALMFLLGVLVFVLGLLVSIAWHELGHLSWAKAFGIRVPQYMVGFGPTVWSRRKGETEYGVKAIPLGGYIRMIGMFPPGEDGRITARSTSPWRSMIEDAREASYEELQPGDETRLFYTRAPWKRVIVMFAGPFMNLVLAVGLFLTAFMGFGVKQTVPTIASVPACVVKAGQSTTACPKGAPPTPAAKAGLRPGDTVLSFDGRPITTYDQLQADIRSAPDKQVTLVVRGKDGTQRTLRPTLVRNQVPARNADGTYVPDRTVTAGFLGIDPAEAVVHLGLGESAHRMGDMAQSGLHSIVALPSKIPGLWNAVFNGAPRAADSPVGVVGAARVGGEIFTLHLPASQLVAFSLQLIAFFNLSLFLFNMLPLLPLDGGHIAGALWESLRRNLARVLRRPDPGPFDVARLMPLAYVVAGVFVCFTVLVLLADVVNPVKLS
ncbi:M50 family metallopeptidase [Streptomyces sp. NPDC001380]|uniref:M50 family metallopeptidase n=1 Tax=Streptomyces sp. NPDC001380 TaxID=3364566 RepID=UPI0036BB4289